MADMDQGVKRLIQMRPADILSFIFPNVQLEYLGMAPTDVATEPQLVLDTLPIVLLQGVTCIIDVEFEAQPTSTIGKRLDGYAARASLVYDLPVLSVVIWLTPHGAPPSSPYEVRVGDFLISQRYFTGLELYKVQAEALLELGRQGIVGLLPLVPFARGGVSEPILEQTAQTIVDQAAADQVAELESLWAVFASRQVDQHVILSMLRRLLMSTEILEQSSLYREWVERAKAEGQKQGLEQGLEQGRELGLEQGAERGKRDGLAEATQIILEQRFGALPDDLITALAQATISRLEDVLTHLPAESTLPEVRRRLGLTNQPDQN